MIGSLETPRLNVENINYLEEGLVPSKIENLSLNLALETIQNGEGMLKRVGLCFRNSIAYVLRVGVVGLCFKPSTQDERELETKGERDIEPTGDVATRCARLNRVNDGKGKFPLL